MKKIIKWVAGVFLILGAFSFFEFSFIAFLLWFIAGILCLPPVANIVSEKFPFKVVSVAKYYVVIVIGLVVFGGIIFSNNDGYKKSEQERAIKEGEEKAIEEAKKDSIDKVYQNSDDYKRTTEISEANKRPENYLTLDYKGWKIDGFGTVGIHSFNITNTSKYSSFKDIVVKFIYYAESGTELDTKTETVYKIVKAGSKIKVRDFNAGFIPSQAKSCRVEVVGATSL